MSYTVYECQRNSDQTEGRGGMVTFHITADLDEAVAKVQGEGVMGYGTGDVVEVVYASGPHEFVNGSPILKSGRIYGSRSRKGRWDYGFLDLRDVVEDPEWPEYVRLYRKFNDGKSPR